MGGRTGSLMNARLTQQNFLNEALDLIEEDQGNLTVANDDGNESSDEETRQQRQAPVQQV